MSELEDAFAVIATDTHFATFTPAELSATATFVRAIRTAPHASVIALQNELETIAFETDDYGEASGVLIQVAALGGGLATVDASADIPVDDADAFATWVIDTSRDEPAAAAAAARDALIKALIASEDSRDERRRHRACLALVHYGLESAAEISSPVRDENHDLDFEPGELVHPRLWEAFARRPESERTSLIAGWWGPASAEPHDLPTALEWQRAGHVELFMTSGYFDAVAELLLSWCEPNPDLERPDHSASVIARDPQLSGHLTRALSDPNARRWLVGDNTALRASHLAGLVVNGVDGDAVRAALAEGAERDSDPHFRDAFAALRDAIRL